MKAVLRLAAVSVVLAGLSLTAAATRANDDVADLMSEYLMFAEFNAGIISPQQIDEAIFKDVLFVDTRTADHFAASTIPGAVHIEWREVIDRRDELPDRQKIVLFCETGVLSAQAMFGLRLLGYENAVVLQGGYQGWQKNAAYKP